MRRIIKRFGLWIDRQTKERPFFSALVVLILVVAPGAAKLENAIDTARDAAASAASIVRSENARDQLLALANCQTRNTASQKNRERFDNFFKAIELVFTNSPNMTPERKEEVKKFVNDLRKAVPLDPHLEDVDCNDNGRLGLEDYVS